MAVATLHPACSPVPCPIRSCIHWPLAALAGAQSKADVRDEHCTRLAGPPPMTLAARGRTRQLVPVKPEVVNSFSNYVRIEPYMGPDVRQSGFAISKANSHISVPVRFDRIFTGVEGTTSFSQPAPKCRAFHFDLQIPFSCGLTCVSSRRQVSISRDGDVDSPLAAGTTAPNNWHGSVSITPASQARHFLRLSPEHLPSARLK
jgi:hypothetical protein